MGAYDGLAFHLRSIRLVEDLVRDIEDECAINGIDADRSDILVAILCDIEEIAHREFGDGPGFLADVAAATRQFRQENASPASSAGGSRHH